MLQDRPTSDSRPPAPQRRPDLRERWRLMPTALKAGVVLVLWFVVWLVLRGQDTLVLPGRDSTAVHDWLTGFRDDLLASRDTNVFMQFTGVVSDAFSALIEYLQGLVAAPAFPRPVPEIGWLGVVALATWVGYAIASWRIAVLVAASFVSFGLLGYWEESMDTLLVTLSSVGVAVLVGIPLGILIGRRKWAENLVTPVLDVMQTMPTFVYLIPVVLFFGIGTSGAVAATIIYALPPVIRITGHGIRTVSTTTIEASDSLGQTDWQRLRHVQLPMARKTIIVGINQTTMAALSMVVLAAFVNGPGLGEPVLESLRILDIGRGFVPSLAIVVMAIMLDRSTTAASERSERVARSGGEDVRRRRITLAVTGAAAIGAVLYSRYSLWAAEFPETSVGSTLADWTNTVVRGFTDNYSSVTSSIKDGITAVTINPLEALIADSPWYLMAAVILALGFILGGWRVLPVVTACLAGLYFLDLWHDAMVTLTMVLVATAIVMVLALVIGVWMARSARADLVIRPVLDAAQTIPPFVYLLPSLALFGPGRFAAIVAAVVYSAPVAIKLVTDGIRGVPETTLEASRSTGTSRWQEIRKVQIPMARGSLVLAANQGLLYVLSMVAIGGLVGAGALGYAVALGVSRSEEWGKGMAAGISIVLLGILLDRIMRGAARVKADPLAGAGGSSGPPVSPVA
ncbi:ABC transporter permease subunit [Nocardioides sp. HDW12B]|uniref:ABC transporter permease n=1 Tax=Nocardioides sp. HDW12B TaxID=2714939 RepID=UPI00197EAA14|nr:ABC transporter permease subunit [Nocardioides sp. HDW12B]